LSNLTEEQQEDIKQKFVHFDTDNNGKISINGLIIYNNNDKKISVNFLLIIKILKITRMLLLFNKFYFIILVILKSCDSKEDFVKHYIF
jgi:hypothetical protein